VSQEPPSPTSGAFGPSERVPETALPLLLRLKQLRGILHSQNVSPPSLEPVPDPEPGPGAFIERSPMEMSAEPPTAQGQRQISPGREDCNTDLDNDEDGSEGGAAGNR